MTTTSLIFEDSIYGVNGTRFFPGSYEETKSWFNEINQELKNFIESSSSVKGFLDDPEGWSSGETRRYEAEIFKKEF